MKKIDAQNELGRELDMRRKVYPTLIIQRKLNQEQATRQINRMVAAWSVLEAMTEEEFQDLLKCYDQKNSSGVGQQMTLL